MARCMGCMEEYDEQYGICPKCGYATEINIDEAIQIIPGNMLGNRFIVGKVIGSGAFGVTYIGWDTVLNTKVAIREYLPSEFSTRIPGQMTVTVFENEKGEQFKSGLEKFVNEAKKLAKFNNTPGIVKVYDSFYENNTAYIIMEYLEGEVLSDVLKRQKTFPVDTAIGMMLPIMESLKLVHKEGIIHRDIAPDNIMITKTGEIKLIDFAAARYATTSHSRSLSVIVKQGYSPEEQYRSRGDQGAHTDVYSVAATLYKMVTGVTPPDALERRAYYESKKKDILIPIVKNCKDIANNKENAILNALNVRIEDRTADMDKFIEDLTTDKPVKRIYGKIKKIDILRWPLWLRISVPTAAVTIATLAILFVTGVIGFDANVQTDIKIPDGMTRVPALVNQRVESAESIMEEAKLSLMFTNSDYDNVIPKDYVLLQSVNAGYITEQNSVVEVVVSIGPEMKEVPSCVGLSKEEAQRLMEEAGFVTEYTEEYSLAVPKDYIVSQEEEGGQYLPKGTKIKLIVSMGKDPIYQGEAINVKVPDFVGMDYEEAINVAIDNNITIVVSEKKYSNEYDANVVMAQDLPYGTEISNDKAVSLVVSLGIHYVKVPSVVFKPETEAIAILSDNGLKYEVLYAESENVPKGNVMSQSPEDESMVLEGDTVTITVSSGKGKFEMPNVAGKEENAAMAELRGKGLVVSVSYEKSETVTEGNVISQSIAAGTLITSSEAVELVVSSGEPLYEVPDVIGMEKNDANNLLKKGKFNIQIGEDYCEDIAEGNIFSQTLEPGTQHKKNTDIVIMVSKGKMPLTITFDGNGGTPSKTSNTTHLGEGYGELATATRTGYTFDGWYTAASGGDKITASSIVSVKLDQIIYARWVANTYKVSFDANGGTPTEAINVIYDSAYGAIPSITRTGYGFKGWWTEKDGGEQVTSTSTVKITKDVTLYAHWEAGTITVTLQPNGGSCDIQNFTAKYDDKYTGLTAEPTRTGYTFDGWYTQASGGEKITADTVVNNSTDHTLFAHWIVNTYTVTFDSQGGGTVDSKAVNYNTTVGVLPTPSNKTGYSFGDWYTKANGEGEKVTEATIVTENVTYYAKWNINTYTVTFDSQGGSSVSSKAVDYNNAVGTLKKPTRTGYDFKGWYTKASGGTKITESTKITANVTYYAQWTIKTYTVTFNANGGTCSTTTLKVNYNGTISTLPQAKKTGYTSPGWYLGSTKLTTSTKITANVTYTAKWTIDSYKVTFNANGGTCSTSSKNVNYNNTIGTLPTPKRDYYNFKGWYTKSSGGTKITASTKITANVTYYAQWNQNDIVSWTLYENVPAGAEIIEAKWAYTQDYSSWSDWSPWQDTAVTGSSTRKVETQEVPDGEAYCYVHLFHHKYYKYDEAKWYWTYSYDFASYYGSVQTETVRTSKDSIYAAEEYEDGWIGYCFYSDRNNIEWFVNASAEPVGDGKQDGWEWIQPTKTQYKYKDYYVTYRPKTQ